MNKYRFRSINISISNCVQKLRNKQTRTSIGL